MMHIEVTDHVVESNIYVDISLGRDFLDAVLRDFGKNAFNEFMNRMRRLGLEASFSTPEPTDDDETCAPICLTIDLSKEDFEGADLSNLDLSVPNIEGANFRGANLRKSCIGSAVDATFADADLRGADFSHGCVTGANFEGALLEYAEFEYCRYYRARPPVGLPERWFSQCRPFPDRWGDPHATEPEAAEPDASAPAVLTVKSAILRSFWGSAN